MSKLNMKIHILPLWNNNLTKQIIVQRERGGRKLLEKIEEEVGFFQWILEIWAVKALVEAIENTKQALDIFRLSSIGSIYTIYIGVGGFFFFFLILIKLCFFLCFSHL